MLLRTLWISLSLLALTACGGDGLTTGDAERGQMKLFLTGATQPHAVNTVIDIDAVELQPVDGPLIRLPIEPSQPIDLATAQGPEPLALLEGVPLPAGQFLFLRLQVNASPATLASFITFADGGQQPLFLDNEDGLLIPTPFEVPAQGVTELVIDIDLSGTPPTVIGGAGIPLQARLRLFDARLAARLSGRVDPSLVTAADCVNDLSTGRGNQVLLFPPELTLDDDGRASVAPITRIPVRLDPLSGDFVFEDAFLPSGDFIAAFTCQALRTQTNTDDLLRLSQLTRLQLIPGNLVTQDFGPALLGFGSGGTLGPSGFGGSTEALAPNGLSGSSGTVAQASSGSNVSGLAPAAQ